MSRTDNAGRATPADDPSWEQYASTRLELLADRSLVLDLTRAIPADALQRLARHHVGPSFAVLTACNPHGVTASDASNEQRSRSLSADVVATGAAWVPADGVSLDGRHREIGLAAPIPRDDARTLARKYGQSAFFWFDGRIMWLVGAAVDTPDLPLPRR